MGGEVLRWDDLRTMRGSRADFWVQHERAGAGGRRGRDRSAADRHQGAEGKEDSSSGPAVSARRLVSQVGSGIVVKILMQI